MNTYSLSYRMFGMVVDKLFVVDLQKVSGTSEKKICAAGVTRLLTESAVMLRDYESSWPQLLQALIGLFELPEDDSIPADEHFIEIEDTPGTENKEIFVKLYFQQNFSNGKFYKIKTMAKYFWIFIIVKNCCKNIECITLGCVP